MRKRWLIVGLVLLVVLALTAPASAGIMTTGSYTYMLRGNQIDYAVDILPVKGGYLVPPDVLESFQLTPTVTGENIVLKRGPVRVELRLGSDIARVDGRQLVTKAAPSYISGRLFLPAEVLPELGISMEVDGRVVLLTDHVKAITELGSGSPNFQAAWNGHSTQGSLRLDGQYAYGTFTVLTKDLLSDPGLQISWGVRQRLLDLLETRTLVYVHLRNTGIKAISLDPAKMILVDPNGQQYDYLKLEVPVEGTVSAPVAPGAHRASVLAFPKVEADYVSLYHDAAGNVIGTVPTK